MEMGQLAKNKLGLKEKWMDSRSLAKTVTYEYILNN
jgi:hypothetical protein